MKRFPFFLLVGNILMLLLAACGSDLPTSGNPSASMQPKRMGTMPGMCVCAL